MCQRGKIRGRHQKKQSKKDRAKVETRKLIVACCSLCDSARVRSIAMAIMNELEVDGREDSTCNIGSRWWRRI